MPPKKATKDEAKNGSGKAAAPTTKGGLSTAFSDGARYNNLIAALVQNPFHYRFDLFGEKRHAMIQQFPQFGIGGVLWDCEYVLSAYLLSEGFRKSCHQASFLELGAGTGLAAVVAWLLGGVAIATDLPEVVTAATSPNVTINQNENASGSIGKRRNQIAAANLSWGSRADCVACVELLAKMAKGVPLNPNGGVGASSSSSSSDSKKAKTTASSSSSPAAASSSASAAADKRQFDYIIAADVIYHSDQHVPLLATMAQLMHSKSKLIFVHRRRFDNDSNFVEPLLEMFEVVKKTPVKDIMSEYPKDNLTIYEFVVRKEGIPESLMKILAEAKEVGAEKDEEEVEVGTSAEQ